MKRVGVVVDGRAPFYESLGAEFKAEAQRLLQGEFTLELAGGSPVYCDFTRKCVEEKMKELLENNEVDLVLGQGFLASAALLKEKTFPKPALAPFVLDPQAQGLNPEKVPRNLAYLLWTSHFESELRALDELAPFKNLVVLVGDRGFGELSENVRKSLLTTVEAQSKNVTLILAENAEQVVAALPAGTEAAYVGPLLEMPAAEQQKLAQKLTAARVATFSWLGEEGVRNGFLLGTQSQSAVTRLARRVALSVQSLLLGESPEPVSARPEGQRKIINAATAASLGLSPNVSELIEAKLIGESNPASARSSGEKAMSLKQAVELALQNNVQLKAAKYGVDVVAADSKQARSPLLPQLGLSIGARIIDADRALPTNRQRQASWGATARQALYDGRSWGSLSSANDNTKAQEESRHRTELDTIYQVASAYIELLSAKTTATIQKKDLKLSQENLDMARVRKRVGQAGMEEVYRWESRIAQSRRKVLAAEARMASSRVAINTLLNRPANTSIEPEDLQVDTEGLLSANNVFVTHLQSPQRLETLQQFLVNEGLQRAPELREIDFRVKGIKRQVSAEKQSYFIPTISVEGAVNHRFAQGGSGELPPSFSVTGLNADNLDWQVGVVAELPFFEGALKSARVGKGNAQVGQLSYEKKNVALQVEQSVRQSLYLAAASYAAIQITEDALSAAEGNLRIVREKYQRGRASIIELLDAQNQTTVAKNDAADAVYSFLADLMEVERATGRFDFQMSSNEQQALLLRLTNYTPTSEGSQAGNRAQP